MSLKNLVVPTIVGAVLVIYILLSCEGPGCGDPAAYQAHVSPFTEFMNAWGL